MKFVVAVRWTHALTSSPSPSLGEGFGVRADRTSGRTAIIPNPVGIIAVFALTPRRPVLSPVEVRALSV